MSGYEVEVIKASQSALDGARLLTLRLRYPRIVLAEFNTHKDPSRNTSSSRAIPTPRLLDQVRQEPAMPARFGANQSGMQDKGEEHDADVKVPEDLEGLFFKWVEPKSLDNTHWYVLDGLYSDPRTFWRFMAYVTSLGAEAYHDAGFHKQIGNRWTETAQWTNQLVTWDMRGLNNFLWLRDHKDADPTIAKIAGMIRERLPNIFYEELQEGEWHLPYSMWEEAYLGLEARKKLSTARCARVSYAPFDGNASHEKEFQRHDDLVKSVPPHASPTEHLATPALGRHANLEGWKNYRTFLGI